MKPFLKHAALVLGIQIALLLVLGVVGNLISPAVDYLFELLLRIYEPFIVFVVRVGRFKGESAIIEPVWIGILLGVLSYSALFGCIGLLLSRRRQ